MQLFEQMTITSALQRNQQIDNAYYHNTMWRKFGILHFTFSRTLTKSKSVM